MRPLWEILASAVIALLAGAVIALVIQDTVGKGPWWVPVALLVVAGAVLAAGRWDHRRRAR